jgi:hypothetical protein
VIREEYAMKRMTSKEVQRNLKRKRLPNPQQPDASSPDLSSPESSTIIDPTTRPWNKRFVSISESIWGIMVFFCPRFGIFVLFGRIEGDKIYAG